MIRYKKTPVAEENDDEQGNVVLRGEREKIATKASMEFIRPTTVELNYWIHTLKCDCQNNSNVGNCFLETFLIIKDLGTPKK
jgi:hypothetical protein